MLKTYVIDIDGTICDKDLGLDYDASIPKLDRIEKINQLYDQGYTIKYVTARGMGRYNSTVLPQKFMYYMAYYQLKSWGCKLQHLIMGKPSGDIYIDDKGINSDDFFN